MRVVLSSGHGKYVRGASGYLDEVDEARRVVEAAATFLRGVGVETITFHDAVSKSQNENLNRIVNFHNSKTRDLDVSVHFNAYQTTNNPMGTECLYYSQSTLAGNVADAIAAAGHLIDRGPKKRTDLFFLNNTHEPAILIEVCFVDSRADADLYRQHFNAICAAIAETISGRPVGEHPPVQPPTEQPPSTGAVLFSANGKCSTFGGPYDDGVSPSEGLAFIQNINEAPQLFLPSQPSGTTGLARRLNPAVHYIACRWDYDRTPREMLKKNLAVVKAIKTGVVLKAFPADWGPHTDTGRVADLSPALADALRVVTDDEVEVTFPYHDAIV